MPTDTAETNDTSTVTYVAGHAVEQTEGLDSNLEEGEREAAKEAVRKAIAGEAEDIGKDSATKAKKSKEASPFKPEGMKTDADKGKEDVAKEVSLADQARERDAGGKFLPKEPKSSPKTSDLTRGEPTPQVPGDDTEEVLDLDKASVKQLLSVMLRTK